jgi:esterase/lipase
VPTLVIHTRDDIHILPENAEMLFENIGSPEKEHIWVENTSHNLVRDGDTLKVFQPVADFIERHSNS